MSYSLKHTFVASDCHFGSYKLNGFWKVFTEDQEKELIEKWNLVVGKDDLVYYNGDFCDGNFRDLCSYLKLLNGQIILVRGNHDVFSDGIYKAVFKDILDEVVLKDLDITIHHIPGIVQTRCEIFGHLHRNVIVDNSNYYDKFCSCVQSNDGYPTSLEHIMLKLR